MNIKEFKRILNIFADHNTEVEINDKEFLIQVNEILLDGKLDVKDKAIYVIESDVLIPARTWIARSLAKLEILANRLTEMLPTCSDFVEPELKISETLYDNKGVSVEKNQRMAAEKLITEEKINSTNVVYLISDAGEGKTTFINEIAKTQANSYCQNKAECLIVPISLGGRTFLRFDDITVGVLHNQYRFSHLRYAAFIELVRLGLIIPAFDGFEEMFVENNTGEATSALGILLSSLESEGSLLIAARKAYFDFNDIKNQEKLFDTIRNYSVSFNKIEIKRWDKKQFIDYCINSCIENAEFIYEKISKKIGIDHSLLTRPVLIKQLVHVISENANIDGLIEDLYVSNDKYFATFVKAIIEREAKEKWIDKLGEIATPLLSIDEHCQLLSDVAVEMWNSKNSQIKLDMLELITEFYCDTKSKSASVTTQVKERIKSHALLVNTANNQNSLSFDHDEFYQYFLGEAIAERLISNFHSSELFSILQKNYLTEQAKIICFLAVKREQKEAEVISRLLDIMNIDGHTSFTHINTTCILFLLLNKYQNQEIIKIQNASFSSDILEGAALENIHFENCFFEKLNLDNALLTNCNFTMNKIINLSLTNNIRVNKSIFDENNTVNSLLYNNQTTIYEPEKIKKVLDKFFYNLDITDFMAEELIAEDEEIKMINKILSYFLRSTHMGENIMRMKLSKKSTDFINTVLPLLLERNVFEEIKNISSTKERRFRLKMPLKDINSVIIKSNGRYQKFLEILEGNKN